LIGSLCDGTFSTILAILCLHKLRWS